MQSKKNYVNTAKIQRQAEAIIPTPFGTFRMIAYAETPDNWMPHLALLREETALDKPVLTRLHSECITGDLFASKRCDCGEQLQRSLQQIGEQGGVLIYLRQEGRGIGIINKLKAYNLQDLGLDTIDANRHLGLEVDARQYDIGVHILRDLGIRQVQLLTNNPEKLQAFDESKVKVINRIPIIANPKDENADYLKTKQYQMGHLFDLF